MTHTGDRLDELFAQWSAEIEVEPFRHERQLHWAALEWARRRRWARDTGQHPRLRL